jgi:hypothetical protein
MRARRLPVPVKSRQKARQASSVFRQGHGKVVK